MLYTYKSKLIKVIDGDTLDVLISAGFGIYYKTRLRLNGINAPESRTRNLREKKLGLKAKRLTENFCKSAEYLVVKTEKAGKFGRYLAEVFNEKDQSLTQLLLDKKLARVYHGGKRKNWFEDIKVE